MLKPVNVMGFEEVLENPLLKLKISSLMFEGVGIFAITILRQSEELRGVGEIFTMIIDGETFELRSNDSPEIGDHCVYIRGEERDYDDNSIWRYFEGEDELTKYTRQISTLLNGYFKKDSKE